MTPSIVNTSGVNTPPKVPNFLTAMVSFVCLDLLMKGKIFLFFVVFSITSRFLRPALPL